MSHASSGVVCSMRSYVKPALFTMWLILPNFLCAAGEKRGQNRTRNNWPPTHFPAREAAERRTRGKREGAHTTDGTVRYVPKGSRDDLFGEVVRRDISADSERVAACGLDLVDDDICCLREEYLSVLSCSSLSARGAVPLSSCPRP